jgi:hypothetical protein
MKFRFALLPAMLLAASFSAAGAASGIPASMKLGDTWIYRVKGNGAAPYQQKYQLLRKDTRGDYLVSESPPSNELHWGNITSVRAPSISASLCMFDFYMHGTLGLDDTCTADLRVGRAWSQNKDDSVGSVRNDYVIAALEDVEVPAGRFKAFRIEGREIYTETAYPGVAAPPNGYVTTAYVVSWYVPGTGIVKGTLRRTTGTRLLEESLRELEQFVPGPR